MATARDTPYGAFNFLVSLTRGAGEVGDIAAGFSEVSGLNTEMTIAEYRTGNDRENHTHKFPGTYKSGDVTFKRGVVGTTDIWEWLDAMRRGDDAPNKLKREVVVKLLNEKRDVVFTWKLKGAMPMKWTGPTMTAKGGGDVAMEELVLSIEKVEYE